MRRFDEEFPLGFEDLERQVREDEERARENREAMDRERRHWSQCEEEWENYLMEIHRAREEEEEEEMREMQEMYGEAMRYCELEQQEVMEQDEMENEILESVFASMEEEERLRQVVEREQWEDLAMETVYGEIMEEEAECMREMSG